ncbi:MAG: phosphate ABC transporter permease subunit PstC [Bacillota bacterium]|nr:phosphate ABC transporter permease subunit PstC [Bacillota bacterium]
MNDKVIRSLLFVCAAISVVAVLLITVMIFVEAFPALKETGVWDFIAGTKWKPTDTPPQFGILPMIVGSVYVTGLALLFGLPIGMATSIFMAEIAPPKVAVVLRRAIEILAGIPSVVYGFFGLMMVVPIVQTLGGTGMSVLTASIILAVMILPTIVSVSEAALRAVPAEYKEGSLALGASHWQTIVRVQVPAAKSGILAATVLGIGRAVGETMAVILVAGNIPVIPESILKAVRTMTVNIVLEMGYVQPGSLHYSALFATGAVLFVFIMLLNFSIRALTKTRGEKQKNAKKH